jgi:Na+/proline symporter
VNFPRAAALLLGFVVFAGCASRPPVRTGQPRPLVSHVSGVPFFEDDADQCGPSSLASLLSFWGYAARPAAVLPEKLDAIFPHFIGREMPTLLKGWLLSAIVLAGIDSPLASLATSFVTDVYRPLAARAGSVLDDRRLVGLSRLCVAAFGVLLALVAWGFSRFENILWLAFKIGGVTFGSLLGVFLLGLLTRRGRTATNLIAMGVSAGLNLVLLVLSERGLLPLGWSWLVILGTFVTFGLGYTLSPREKRQNHAV